MNAAEVLVRVQKVLNQRGWIRGSAETPLGVCLVQAYNIATRELVGLDGGGTVIVPGAQPMPDQIDACYDAARHLAWAIGIDTESIEADYRVSRWQIMLSHIIQWNDRYSRTYVDVVNALERAIVTASVEVPNTVPVGWSVPEPAGA